MPELTRTLTRGAALGGLAALASGCGIARSAVMHATGKCLDGPYEYPLHDSGPIIRGIVPASHIQRPVRYALVLPRNVDPHTVDRVIYLLPGRGSSADDAVTPTGYAAMAQEIMRAGGKPFAVLAIDSGETYFHPRTSGEDRLRIVERDLPDVARTHLAPILTYEALAGVSMGGYGALLAAQRNPARFKAVAVAGPALFRSFDEENHAIGDGFDNAAQFAAYDVFARAERLAKMPLMIRVGYGDPFYANVKAFATHVPHADVKYVERGCHDDGFWRFEGRDLLTFASSH